MSAFCSDIKDAPLLALKYSESSIYSSSENLLLLNESQEGLDPLKTLNQLISPVSVKSRDVYNRLAQRKKLFTFSDNQQENVNIINRARPRPNDAVMSTCKTSAIASTISPYVESCKKRRRQSVQISAMLQSVNSIAATPIRLNARADGGLLSPTPAKDIMIQSHTSNKLMANKSINRSSTSSSSFEVLEKKLKCKSTDMLKRSLNLKDASKRDINDIFNGHFSSSEQENCDEQPYLVPLQTPSVDYNRKSGGFVANLSPEVLFHEIYFSHNRRSIDNSLNGTDNTVELVELEAVDLASGIQIEIEPPSSTSQDDTLGTNLSSKSCLSTDGSEEVESLLIESEQSLPLAPTSGSKYTFDPSISASYDPDFEQLTIMTLLDGFKSENLVDAYSVNDVNDSNHHQSEAIGNSSEQLQPIEEEDDDDDDGRNTDKTIEFETESQLDHTNVSPMDRPDQLSMNVDSYVHDAVAALCLEDVDFDVEEETTETNTVSDILLTTILPETSTVSNLSNTPPTADQNETAEQRESPKARKVNFVMENDSSAIIDRKSVSTTMPTTTSAASTSTQNQKRRSVSAFTDSLTPVLQLKRRVESSIAEVMRSGEKLFSSKNNPARPPVDGNIPDSTVSSSLKQKSNNKDSWGIGRISMSASKKNALVQNMRRIDEETKSNSKGKQSTSTSSPEAEENGGHNFKPQVKNPATLFFESAMKSATRSVDSESLKERTFRLSGRHSANSASVFDLFDGREICDGNSNNNSFFFESTSSYGSWKTPSKQHILGDLPTLKVCDSVDIGRDILGNQQAEADHAFDGKERRRSIDTLSTSSSLKQQQATSRRLSAPKGSSSKSSPTSGSTRLVSSSTSRTPAYLSASKSRNSLQSKSTSKNSADVSLAVSVNRPPTPHACPISSTSSSPKDAAASTQLSKSSALIRTKKFNFSDPAVISSSVTTMEEVEKSSESSYFDVFVDDNSSNPPTPKVSNETSVSPTISASKPISNTRQSLSNTSILRSKSSSNILVSGRSPISPSADFPMKTPIKTTLSSEDQKGRFSTSLTSYKSLSKLSSKSGESGCLGSSRCARVPVTGPPKKKEPVRTTSSLRLSSSSSSSLFKPTGIAPLKDGDSVAVSRVNQSVSKPTRSDPMVDKQDGRPTSTISLVRKASENRMSFDTASTSTPGIPSNETQNRSDSIASNKYGGKRSSFNTPNTDSPLCEFYPNVEAYVTPFSMSAIGLPEESPALGSSTTGVATISPCKNLFDRRISSSYSLNNHNSPDNSTTNSHNKKLPISYKESTASHSDKSIMDCIDSLNITIQSLCSPTLEDNNSSVHIDDAGSVRKVDSSGERIPQQQVISLDNISIANDETSSQILSMPSTITTSKADYNLTQTPRAPQPLQQSSVETPQSVVPKSSLKFSAAPLTAPKISASSPFKSPRYMMISAEKRSRDLKEIAISCDNILNSITKIKF